MRFLRNRCVVVGQMIALCATAYGQNPLTWETPITVNSNAGADGTDSRKDSTPHLDTDGNGTWIVVWTSKETHTIPLGDSLESDEDVMFARSLDNGATWSPAIPLNSSAFDDPIPFAGDFRGLDKNPWITYLGDDKWIGLWNVADPSLPDLDDDEIMFALSSDGGQTWSDMAILNSNFDTDGGQGDAAPQAATDYNGTIVVDWQFHTGLSLDVVGSTSVNGGSTWSAQQFLTTESCCNEFMRATATDTAGNWITVYNYADFILGPGLGISRSSDNGITWTPADHAQQLTASAVVPAIATDRRGTWIVTFANQVEGSDNHIFYIRSRDNGTTWSDFQSITPNLPIPNGHSSDAKVFTDIETDGRGNWIALWPEPVADTDRTDVFASLSTNDGDTWSDPVRVNSLESVIDRVLQQQAHVRTDRQGNWIAVFESIDVPGNGAFDIDIASARATFTGDLRGTITAADTPLSCAAIHVFDVLGDVDRVAVTDVNGDYFFTDMPIGSYSLEVFGTGAPIAMSTIAISVGETTTEDVDLGAVGVAARISGTVFGKTSGTGGDEEPVFGARIDAKINDLVVETTYTCGGGLYGLLLENVAKGDSETVTLEVSADGYIPQTIPVILPTGDNVETNATLEKAINFPSTLTGVVMATNGTPLQAARVEASGAVTLASLTDQNGVYTFDAIPSGVFDIRASAAEYTSSSKVQAVSNEASVVLNFELAGGPNAEPADINGDNAVNSIDIQLVINSVLGISSEFPTDINNDATTNSIDIQLVINTVLGL